MDAQAIIAAVLREHQVALASGTCACGRENFGPRGRDLAARWPEHAAEAIEAALMGDPPGGQGCYADMTPGPPMCAVHHQPLAWCPAVRRP